MSAAGRDGVFRARAGARRGPPGRGGQSGGMSAMQQVRVGAAGLGAAGPLLGLEVWGSVLSACTCGGPGIWPPGTVLSASERITHLIRNGLLRCGHWSHTVRVGITALPLTSCVFGEVTCLQKWQ